MSADLSCMDKSLLFLFSSFLICVTLKKTRIEELAMKEKIYTIPLMDAFKAEDECPFCFIERNLEQHAIDFVLGSGASYMEDDVRQKLIKWDFAGNTIKKCLIMAIAWAVV